MRKTSEIRDLSPEELDATLIESRKELFNTVNEWQRTKKLEKPHLLQQKRKEIARLLTVMTEKQHEQATKKVAKAKKAVRRAPKLEKTKS